jgi:energy-coupling factor transporter ATP-binding protein EcfA2
MPTGPLKIILINAGKYDFAEVDLDGTLQIVGPNNTGKTTLINTLQFLYINDQREMDFGSYTKEQTRDFYFRSQYSYILFECLSNQGRCVFGWRGQSKASGGDPERFVYQGAYAADDFFDERGQVREARDVNARLALRQYQAIRTQQQHRELLLNPSGAESPGLGIVVLRDHDKYHHFRETLKNLLSLSTITQDQMRDRLLMLADISPEAVALDARQLFGEDYDLIRRRRESLLRFKSESGRVATLVERHAERETVRGEMIYRWSDLRSRKAAFEEEHTRRLERLRQAVAAAEERIRLVGDELQDRRADQARFSEERGALRQQLDALQRQGAEFLGFVEGLERTGLEQLGRDLQALERQISEGESENGDKARQKVAVYSEQVRQREGMLRDFDHLAVTVLRKRFRDEELDRLFSVLNFELLEQHIGDGGLSIRDESRLETVFRTILARTTTQGYQDDAVALKFRAGRRSISELADVATVRERLMDDQETLARWRRILESIERREALQRELSAKRQAHEAKSRTMFRWEEYRKAVAEQPRIEAELSRIDEALAAAGASVQKLEAQLRQIEEDHRELKGSIIKAEDDYGAVMGQFDACRFPEFAARAQAVPDIPADFGAAIALYQRAQDREESVSEAVADLLRDVELHLGEEYVGQDETETVRNVQAELEALPEKEEALARDWNAHIHGLKGAFDHVLKELSELQSAADQLNRQFSRVQVSNLKALRIEAQEQSDVVTWVRRLAEMEQPSLFDEGTALEPTLRNFRTKLESTPVIRYSQLFTLRFTVVGDDEVARHYQDFRQIESHGTTITIKVLFNLLVLKSLLRKDDCVVPFFLDEIQALDPANRHAILTTARKLGFVAITAAPESVTEVDSLYFLQPHKGRVVLRHKHRLAMKLSAAEAAL